MQVNWEAKFQQSQLSPQDCLQLLNDIEHADDPWIFAKLAYYYGYSYPEHPRVVSLCESYIIDPVPGVTATCLRILVDYWCLWEKHAGAIESYLDLDLYDDWYDEVIFSVGWVSRNSDLPLPSALIGRMEMLRNDPRFSTLGLSD